MHRRKIIAANWKMNKIIAEAVAFARELRAGVDLATGCDVVIIPPFFCVRPVAEALSGSPIEVGAQDLHWEASGAFTGEVSAAMVKDAGATHVLVGHSERRHGFGESDAVVAKKLLAALRSGLTAILCVGETLAEREAGHEVDVVERQLAAAFGAVDEAGAVSTVVAYEPVWAIGTGRTASTEDAVTMHRAIRDWMQERFGETVAASQRIQYGGSVNAANAAELLSREDIDGLLVGGASLEAASFAAIVRSVPGGSRLI
ncbi:MAG TPA: triose-phosphate isomerase [Candidatus Krumholzibacteria bacterium]|nr:triose-phosphate isomerase [Candidatus Krumholzibacteria bacterium]